MFQFIKKWFSTHLSGSNGPADEMDIETIHNDLFQFIFNQNIKEEEIDGFLAGLETILVYYRHQVSVMDSRHIEMPMSITTDVNRPTLGIHNHRSRNTVENDWTSLPALTVFYNNITNLPMTVNTQDSVVTTRAMKLYSNWREYTNNNTLEVVMFLDAALKLSQKIASLPTVEKRHFFFNVYSPLFVVMASVVDFASAIVNEVDLDNPIKI